ncbi:MAG: METTL5 family protein [Archaeoglobaceae archaeon]|nr:METTL5 family protein [Archaeoglobaceae archaeon]MCX8152529.1 METTL5 family protein [Archaeoglobaceae archaeon]MDW8014050.1 METTL5 family protein [Archaeoglobaceae archaeon]
MAYWIHSHREERRLKRELEITLEKLEGFKNPKIKLEQYVTPTKLAAFILTQAKIFEDIDIVVDLGCGTGILAIGAALLGGDSLGIDVDHEAVSIAKKNAEKIGVNVDFFVCDVKDFCCKKEVTTIMNPPFGIQKRGADRPFLKKALEISKVVYSIHSAGSEEFVKKVASERSFKVTNVWKFKIPLKRTYSFHEKEFKEIAVEVFRLAKLK